MQTKRKNTLTSRIETLIKTVTKSKAHFVQTSTITKLFIKWIKVQILLVQILGFKCKNLQLSSISSIFSWNLSHSRGVLVMTAGQFYSTKPELRFCAGSIPVHGVSKVCHGEDL